MMTDHIAGSFCSTCGESIPNAAQKCSKCGSFQDWRRYFAVGTTVLALVTALVSVIATSLPIVANATTPLSSDVHVRFINGEGGFANILATNAGNRPGAIFGARITYNKDAMPQDFNFDVAKDEEFVEPGKGSRLTLAARKLEFFAVPDNWIDIQEGTCDLEVYILQFSGQETSVREAIDCHELANIANRMRPLSVKPYA